MGRPIDIYREPANRFVAGFIGSPPMNFFDGQIVSEADALFFVAEGMRVKLIAGRQPKKSVEGVASLGIRAEDLVVTQGISRQGDAARDEKRDGHDNARPTINGILAIAERLGASTHLHVDVGPHRVIATVSSDCEIAIDAPLQLGLDPDRVHIFGGDHQSVL
ncbi:MAG: hypothetical protein NVSMB1_24050 [Polyangiales bacterium]